VRLADLTLHLRQPRVPGGVGGGARRFGAWRFGAWRFGAWRSRAWRSRLCGLLAQLPDAVVRVLDLLEPAGRLGGAAVVVRMVKLHQVPVGESDVCV
jgi:hypothetical protein